MREETKKREARFFGVCIDASLSLSLSLPLPLSLAHSLCLPAALSRESSSLSLSLPLFFNFLRGFRARTRAQERGREIEEEEKGGRRRRRRITENAIRESRGRLA